MATQERSGDGPTAAPLQKFVGTVKQVQDGGFIIVRGQPRNGPPPERTLALADLADVPRMARRPTPANPDPEPKVDQPLAWESREFLRKLLVGKVVTGVVQRKDDRTGREYGSIHLSSDVEDPEQNASVLLVREGLAKIRDICKDEHLVAARASAEQERKGLYGPDVHAHVRNVTWDVDDARQLVEQNRGKRIKAVVENVRDGSTIRAFLILPDFYHVTIMLSGVRSPVCKTGSNGMPEADGSEPHGLEAQFFTESKLLQQEVEVMLESCNKSNNMLIASVFHPMGNIAEALLKFGYAKTVDWSLKVVTEGSEKYRAAEKHARENKLKMWQNYTAPAGPDIATGDKNFTGKVVEVVNGDCLMVKRSKTDIRKVHLASIRPPRLAEDAERPAGFRALYDIPHMFEAREFLRKKLIGHNVQVMVDYIQPENIVNGVSLPPKTCCTVMIGDVNVAEALVSRGLATVVIHGQNSDQRSSMYDALSLAEEKAMKTSKGLHNKKPSTARRIADITGEKSKQFLSFLQRAGRMQAVVEFVASASRYRLYIPRENCVITFLLSGIQCPRGERMMPGGIPVAAEPFGNEAHAFVKDMIMQREVEIVVESIDKGGNFIGWCFEGTTNISLALVDEGFASAFIMGDRSAYGTQILAAEEAAKKKRIKRWANYVEEEVKEDSEAVNSEALAAELEAERKVNYVSAVVTEVTPEAKIYVNLVEEGKDLEKMMGELRTEFVTNPPLSGAYQPKRGDLCAAKFVDNNWYRAKVERVNMKEGTASVLYVDYGNRADVPKSQTASLPGAFTALKHFAHEYSLALCQLAKDEEYAGLGLDALKEDLLDKTVKLNVEYKIGSTSYVSLLDGNEQDVGKSLIRDGLLMAEKRGGRRVAKLVDAYQEAMAQAKKEHINIWQYGDITDDDAREFGVGR